MCSQSHLTLCCNLRVVIDAPLCPSLLLCTSDDTHNTVSMHALIPYSISAAVQAVQVENLKLRAELAELSKAKELIDRDVLDRKETEAKRERDIRDRKEKEEREERIRKVRREESLRDIRERERERDRSVGEPASLKVNKLFMSAPCSPVSFVSRAICEIEGKSPLAPAARSVICCLILSYPRVAWHIILHTIRCCAEHVLWISSEIPLHDVLPLSALFV